MARMSPIATSSLAQKTAVASGSAASRPPAAYPEAAVQSPCTGWGTVAPASLRRAAQAAERMRADWESSGPVT